MCLGLSQLAVISLDLSWPLKQSVSVDGGCEGCVTKGRLSPSVRMENLPVQQDMWVWAAACKRLAGPIAGTLTLYT